MAFFNWGTKAFHTVLREITTHTPVTVAQKEMLRKLSGNVQSDSYVDQIEEAYAAIQMIEDLTLKHSNLQVMIEAKSLKAAVHMIAEKLRRAEKYEQFDPLISSELVELLAQYTDFAKKLFNFATENEKKTLKEIINVTLRESNNVKTSS